MCYPTAVGNRNDQVDGKLQAVPKKCPIARRANSSLMDIFLGTPGTLHQNQELQSWGGQPFLSSPTVTPIPLRIKIIRVSSYVSMRLMDRSRCKIYIFTFSSLIFSLPTPKEVDVGEKLKNFRKTCKRKITLQSESLNAWKIIFLVTLSISFFCFNKQCLCQSTKIKSL